MPGLYESFFASKSLTFAAAAIVFLAVAALLTLIFRMTSGRRVRLPRNGRARLPRLGTVDAFDLDRQRQLVIIRRDNVEHLLMIGGPNDILIELEIIRAESREPRDLREARIRDKELREREPRDAPPVPAGISWPPPAEPPAANSPQRKMPIPSAGGLERESGLTVAVPAEESMPDCEPAIVLPSARRPVLPLPPRRMPLAAPLDDKPSNQYEGVHSGASLPQKLGLAPNLAAGLPRQPAAPFLRPPGSRQMQEPAAKPAPSSPPRTGSAESLAASSLRGIETIPTSSPGDIGRHPEFSHAPAPQSAGSAAPAAAAPSLSEPSAADQAQDGAGSLEEEMARLLGRARG